MNLNGQITLAIESAIGGGSISLIDDSGEVACWIGETNVLRAAENLLPTIDDLLKSNGIDLREIRLIAVSAGPGSFTGIRIGLATALGLKTGLTVPMASQSALKAMAFAQGEIGEFVVAVPAGRNAVCWQRLAKYETEIVETGDPSAMAEEEFAEFLENDRGTKFLVHSALTGHTAAPNLIDFGTNVAKAIGMYCRQNRALVAEPLFVSKNSSD